MVKRIAVTEAKWFDDHQETSSLIFDRAGKDTWNLSKRQLRLDGKTKEDITPEEDREITELSENKCCKMLGDFLNNHEGIVKGFYDKNSLEIEFLANIEA